MKISVVTLTFGHEKYIKQAIEGILMQKGDFEMELIIANDNSPDNTDSIVWSIINEDPIAASRIRYTRHTTNLGAMANFIWALKQCTGELIALCEGDDYWTDPDKLHKQLNFLRKNQEFVITFHDVSIISSNGKNLRDGRLKNDKQIRSEEDLVGGAHLPTPTVCFRNVIEDYPPEFEFVANGDSFLFALLGHYGKGYRHNDIGNSCYRLHEGGIWSGKDKISKLLKARLTFEMIQKVAHKKYSKVIFEKLLRINYRLYKNSKDIKQKAKYAVMVLYYYGASKISALI